MNRLNDKINLCDIYKHVTQLFRIKQGYRFFIYIFDYKVDCRTDKRHQVSKSVTTFISVVLKYLYIPYDKYSMTQDDRFFYSCPFT